MGMTDQLLIRPATIRDAATLNLLIRELAEFEHLLQETSVTEEDIVRDGFGDNPKFRAIIAEYKGQPAGYAIMFEFYSTFRGRSGLFLEDVYVRPQYRNKGIGKAILGHVAGIASRENYFCMRWEVLDWNKPAIDFYKSLGAVFLDEWKAVRLIGDPLQALANNP
jgi:GNAT superfamily N-acetyltransferase